MRWQPKKYIMDKEQTLARSFPETTHLGRGSMGVQQHQAKAFGGDLVHDHETGKMTYSEKWRAPGLG
jgi:hypothetical protein